MGIDSAPRSVKFQLRFVVHWRPISAVLGTLEVCCHLRSSRSTPRSSSVPPNCSRSDAPRDRPTAANQATSEFLLKLRLIHTISSITFHVARTTDSTRAPDLTRGVEQIRAPLFLTGIRRQIFRRRSQTGAIPLQIASRMRTACVEASQQIWVRLRFDNEGRLTRLV